MATILVIDDSKFQRKRIIEILKAEGHEILEAPDGKEGLEMAEQYQPNCIVCDMVMPNVGGIEVLKTLREKKSLIPVIILTADIQEPVREHCLNLGARAFLNKPPKKEELIDALKTITEDQKSYLQT
jgi:CheY-like chemotaxis protein